MTVFITVTWQDESRRSGFLPPAPTGPREDTTASRWDQPRCVSYHLTPSFSTGEIKWDPSIGYAPWWECRNLFAFFTADARSIHGIDLVTTEHSSCSSVWGFFVQKCFFQRVSTTTYNIIYMGTALTWSWPQEKWGLWHLNSETGTMKYGLGRTSRHLSSSNEEAVMLASTPLPLFFFSPSSSPPLHFLLLRAPFLHLQISAIEGASPRDVIVTILTNPIEKRISSTKLELHKLDQNKQRHFRECVCVRVCVPVAYWRKLPP